MNTREIKELRPLLCLFCASKGCGTAPMGISSTIRDIALIPLSEWETEVSGLNGGANVFER